MKSAAQLLQEVQDELGWERVLQHSAIEVAVDDGTVTLTGQVHSLAAKVLAEKAAKRVQGVKAVVQHLAVKPPAGEPADQELSRAIENFFRWHCDIPEQAIRVRVQHGWVTLEGEVNWQYQKHAAEKALQYLLGVQGVTNRVVVKPRPVREIRAAILEALHRNALVEDQRVNVEVEGSKVILRGWVNSWMERKAIEKVAWAAPGVTSVEDDLVVAY